MAKGYSDEEIDATKEVAEKVNHEIQTERSEENLSCYNCESMSKVKTDQESRTEVNTETKQAIAEAKNQQNCKIRKQTFQSLYKLKSLQTKDSHEIYS